MSKSRWRYIFTWTAMVVLLISGILLLALSWNNTLDKTPSPSVMVLCWVLLSSSGIFLFMLAVKKAHRQMVDEERSLKDEENENGKKSAARKESSVDSQTLDFAGTARKLVRRTPDDATLEEAGKGLLKNLAKEIEIMSGVFYMRKKGIFRASSSYAMVSTSEPYTFKEGEGMTGQVARNQQLMVITRLPEEHLEVYSGLGKAQPSYLAIIPLVHKNKTLAVLECSGYKYDPHDIENLLRILSRDLIEKLSPNL